MNKGAEELKEAAKRAGSGKWLHSYITPFGNHFIVSEDGSTVINLSTGDVPAKYVDFIVAANPAAVLELIAALEQSQFEREEFRRRLNYNPDWNMLEVANSRLCDLVVELKIAKERIAEFEARQLSVKLPNRLQPGADGPDDWYLHSDPDGEYMKADDVIEAIRAAGGTVEGSD